MTIEIGQRIRASCTFYNEGGTPTNPATVTVRLQTPAGTTTTETATSLGSGVYKIEKVIDQAGNWRVKFTGSGNGVDTMIQSVFHVASDLVG